MLLEKNLIKRDHSLKELTTFKIGGKAKFFVCVNNIDELKKSIDFAKEKKIPILILGGGSNVLISDSGFDGLVIQMDNKGIIVVDEDSDTVDLSIGSGEVWDDVVQYAVDNNYWGIENLSHVPGRMGSFAFQNVGCYGQEASQVVEKVTVFDTDRGEARDLSKEKCGFEYRASIFNTFEKGRYIIINTTIRLKKHPGPNINYPDLQKRFKNVISPQLNEIRQALIEIRNSKFPFPREAKNGNVGSFFKNIILNQEKYEDVRDKFKTNLPEFVQKLDDIQNKFPVKEGVKIPIAFLVDVCGIKGMTVGGAKINEPQPLVILNGTGEATANNVLSLVKKVRNLVMEKTGLYLYIEPELIGFTEKELKNYGFNKAEVKRFMSLEKF